MNDGSNEDKTKDEPPETGESRGEAEKVKSYGGQEGVH